MWLSIEARIKEDASLITLEFNGRHHKNSHKGAVFSRITEVQKKVLDMVVRTNPLCSAKTARQATQNMELWMRSRKFHLI